MAAAGALGAFAAACPARAAERPVALLGDLAETPVVLRGNGPTIATYGYHLPAGARQGQQVWYTIRLHFRITFADDSGAGFAWVMADTNGRTSAQIEYTVRRARDALRIRETSVDIVNGQLEKVFRGPASEVRFRNYLQIPGVSGGRNELRLRLEQAGRARVDRVEVFGDSGVLRTDRSPYPLKLTPRLDEKRIHPGTSFRLVVTLSNRTGEHLRDVVVQPTFDRRVFELLSPKVYRFRAITKPVEASFVFRPATVGRHRIDILADSNRNHPSAAVAVTVTPRPTSSARVVAVWGLALLPIALIGGWLARNRLRTP